MNGLRDRPKSPGAVYSALTVALVVLVGAVALTVRQTPPPPVAEFAPQVRQIRNAPPEQAPFGAPGAAPPTSEVPTPPPPPAPGIKVVPRQLRCVGNPPRQIEDPQSPPCVPFWRGDNGGATWQGVTRDEITIVIPTSNDEPTRLIYRNLEKFFNARFQFYGRRLRFVYSRTDGGSSDPAQQKADAASDAAKFKPFASTNYFSALGYWYQQEMGRRGIIYASAGGVQPRENFRSVYSYIMPVEEMLSNFGEWACGRLAGRTARHAGDAQLRVRTRVFGIIMQKADEDAATPRALTSALGRCGTKPAVTSVNEVAQRGGDPATASALMVKMQNEGVTSILCLCQLINFGVLQNAAGNQGYSPEWIISSYGGNDNPSFIKAGGNPPNQMASTFGVTFTPRQVPVEDQPFYWANREADPTYSIVHTSGVVGRNYGVYRPMLLLASGIQMAGPHLTPASFAQGLERTLFPNPDHYIKAGAVSFAGGRRSMTIDGAEFWWSNTVRSPYEADGTGAYCFVNGGARYRLGSWPKGSDDVFFRPDTECDSGARL